MHSELERADAALAAPGFFTKDASKGEALAKQRAETLRSLKLAETRWIEAAERYESALNGSKGG